MHIDQTTNNSQQKSWYALKVFYNRVMLVDTKLKEHDIESYIPMKYVEQVIGNKRIRRRVPAISSLMFMHCDEDSAIMVQKELQGMVMIYQDRDNKLPYIIPEGQMRTFMAITSVEDLGMEYIGDSNCEWHTGERVRVIDGIFKGAEGYIKRIRGDRRLVVAIEGIVAVATSYIPHCFIEKID